MRCFVRTLKVLAIGFIFCLIFTHDSQADELNPYKKLGRGITNLATAPLEVFLQPIRMAKIDGQFALAPVGGVMQGIYYMVMRMGSGMYDVFTFPMVSGAQKDPIILPETVFDGFLELAHHKWDYPNLGLDPNPYEPKEDYLPYYKRRVALSDSSDADIPLKKEKPIESKEMAPAS